MLLKDWLEKYFSFSVVEEITNVLQKPPLRTTIRVSTHLISTQEAQRKLLEWLDTYYDEYDSPERYAVLIDPVLPDLLVIESIHNPGIVPEKYEVIIDVKTGQSVLRGADVYMPGIIAMSENSNKQTHLANYKNRHPDFPFLLISRYFCKEDQKVSVFADMDGRCTWGSKVDYEGRKYFVGNGISQMTRNEFFKGQSNPQSNLCIRMIERIFPSPPLTGILPPYIFLQNYPSVRTSHELELISGQYILDMCAGVGGKTSHIASIIRNQGNVVAVDRSKNKLGKLKTRLNQFSLDCVQAFCMDATKINEDFIIKCSLNDNGAGEVKKLFDRVLLDPPCSGIGQRPMIILPEININTLSSFADYQKKLFRTAFQCLSVNGILVYSTCTMNPLENEFVVSWALNFFGGAIELLPLQFTDREIQGQNCIPGLSNCGLSKDECLKVARYVPSVENDTIAYFIAKFRKISI